MLKVECNLGDISSSFVHKGYAPTDMKNCGVFENKLRDSIDLNNLRSVE